MAITMSDAIANVKTNFYTVYIRNTSANIAATDYDTLAHWNTFLALFTNIGQCENENVKLSGTPSNDIVVNSGKKVFTTKDWAFEAKYVQATPADVGKIETDLLGNKMDILLVDTVNAKFIYIYNQELYYTEEESSGNVAAYTLRNEQVRPIDSSYRTIGAIPSA